MTTTEPTIEIKARNGVWTPWSLVLCVECDYAGLKDGDRAKHYAKHFEAVAKMDRTAAIDRPEGHLIGVCNLCHRKCWVRNDVALLQQVGFKTSDLDWDGPFSWQLEQTGGMCVALVFLTETRRIVVTAMDGEFYVGEYVLADEGWEDQLRSWQSESLYVSDARDSEMKDAAVLDGLVDECARQVIEFVYTEGAAS